MLVLQSGGCKLRTDHISLILTPQLWPPPALPRQCNNYLSGGYQHQHTDTTTSDNREDGFDNNLHHRSQHELHCSHFILSEKIIPWREPTDEQTL